MRILRSPNRSMVLCLTILIGVVSTAAYAMKEISIGVFDPGFEDHWHHQVFGRATTYDFVDKEGIAAIEARGNRSASGLFTDLSSTIDNEQNIKWQWRVDRIQNSADLTMSKTEDFGASLFLVFSNNNRLFPSYTILVYAWTSMDVPVGTVVISERDPDRFRTIVVANRQTPLASWLRETRNFVQDYEEAYGSPPPEKLRSVGIFTDNDNTQESVHAYYAPITIW